MSTIVRKPQNTRKPWVVRWQDASGKQRERGFATKRDATTFRTETDRDLLHGDYVDPDVSKEDFCTAVDTYIGYLAVSTRSRENYRSSYRANIQPAFTGRTLGSMRNAKEDVADLLVNKMAGKSATLRRQVRALITGTLQWRLGGHGLGDIDIYDEGSSKNADFVPATGKQVDTIAGSAGIVTYLMLGCGLRIGESLAVSKEDFIQRGPDVILRVRQQATRDGRGTMPLKKRKSVLQFRDVPCPAWLWEMVRDLPAGPLQPGRDGRTYEVQESVRQRFLRAAKRAGLPATFTPHSLRHQYGSVLLSEKVPPTDVAAWMGHKDLNTLYLHYRSELAEARPNASAALDRLRQAA